MQDGMRLKLSSTSLVPIKTVSRFTETSTLEVRVSESRQNATQRGATVVHVTLINESTEEANVSLDLFAPDRKAAKDKLSTSSRDECSVLSRLTMRLNCEAEW